MNWFKMVLRGDSITRLIQRQLNSDWSDIIGVGPCDGVVSRQTALSLVGALQAAEGVTTELITNLNSVNFGNATTAAFPVSLKSGQNSAGYVPFNQLVQYGLYFNGYDPGRYDGIFDESTRNQVAAFQGFYGLTGIGLVTAGEVNVSTMKSLLTSKGDTDRNARACDCATVLNAQQALDLKNSGFTHVGRYLTGYVGTAHTPKYLTLNEIEGIKAAGLCVFPIYQDGGYYLEYFKNPSQGAVDAQTAVLAAERIGIPNNTTIYFAVDFDCYEYQIDSFIIPYFRRINLFFHSAKNTKKYKVGIYAPRYVCTKISQLGLANTSFVADMSTGFSCNLGFPIPANWAFDQFYETTFPSFPSFPIDKDAYSGRDGGTASFDQVEDKTDEELEEENRQALLEIARNQYIYDVLDPLGYMDKALEPGITYNQEILLDTYATGNSVVTITAEYATEIKDVSGSDYNIGISVDQSGSLTTSCQDQIAAVASGIDLGELGNGADFSDVLTNIALSVKSGNISLGVTYVTPKQAKFTISVSSPDLLPVDPDVEAGITVEIGFTVTFNDDNDDRFNEEEFATARIKGSSRCSGCCSHLSCGSHWSWCIIGVLGRRRLYTICITHNSAIIQQTSGGCAVLSITI